MFLCLGSRVSGFQLGVGMTTLVGLVFGAYC